MDACLTKEPRRRRCSSSPWPDLPPEVLGLILCQLSSYADRLSFRAVCYQWRLAARQERPVLPLALPWLHQRMDTYHSLPDGKAHRFAVPRAPCNSSGRDAFDGMLRNFGSWVLYEHHNDNDRRCTCRRPCLLRNPFSGTTIHVLWRTIDGDKRVLTQFISKLIVYSCALLLTSSSRRWSLCRPAGLRFSGRALASRGHLARGTECTWTLPSSMETCMLSTGERSSSFITMTWLVQSSMSSTHRLQPRNSASFLTIVDPWPSTWLYHHHLASF
ncbi:hypothetical protein ZWY2020_049240 [Hordeum vulgare]|nr:hypothetical protein ZWY2020_049240 [Hordeum vulgare]